MNQKHQSISILIIIIIIILTGIVTAEEYEYTFEQGNYNQTQNIQTNYTENQTINITYQEFLSGPSSIEFTNTTNNNFDVQITITNSTTPGNYTRNITLSNAADNYSKEISFLFEITTINTTSNTTTNTTTNNIKIIKTYPLNGKIYTLEETKPNIVKITFEGTIDWNKTNIKLKYNNEEVNWITKRPNSINEFSFTIDQTPDGTYSGEWQLTNNENNTTNYNYSFSILTSRPPKATNIKPEKGQYTDETIDLQANINGTTYTIQWIINDGLPTAGNSQWKSLDESGDRYTKTINMENTNLGAIYLKIIDDAGNYRIQPTGIISAPNFEIITNDKEKETTPGEEATYDLTIKKKNTEQKKLRCYMSNLEKNIGTAAENTITITNKAYISYNNEEIYLKTAYDQTMNIGTNFETPIKLNIRIPEETKTGEYTGKITCLTN